MRWPQGFVCPVCGVRDEPYSSTRVRIICRSCHHRTTATAGTIFEKTRTPLTAWFAAIWYVTNQKLGVSALGLQRVLGLASYQTAWTLLHKLRRAMVRAGRGGRVLHRRQRGVRSRPPDRDEGDRRHRRGGP